MKVIRFSVFALLALLVAVSAPAAVIVSYTSGVSAASGQTGAEDPADQGWTLTVANPANSYSDAYDSGDGGWRTVDGTSAGPANYSQTLDSSDQTALTSAPGWEISWTIALDEDAIPASGGGVNDYYLAPNNDRQNNIVTLIDLAADSLGFAITHKVDGSNSLLLEDTSGGSGTYDTGIDIDAFPNFGTFSLTYDSSGGTATLDYGAGTAVLNPGSPLIGGRNAVFFGAGTTGGQGSAVWNEFGLETIPEPASIALIGLMGLAYLLRRKLVKG